MRPDLILLVVLPAFVFAATGALAQADKAGGGMASAKSQIAGAARAWIESLDKRQKDSASFEFSDDERFDWHYFPRRRNGLALKDMAENQRTAARKLVRTTLSQNGAIKVEAIMALEEVLADIEGSGSGFRDPLNYAFTLFGEPGTFPWGWRVEGHHLSINVTLAEAGRIAVTPAFTGTNPARIPAGSRAGERIQKQEYELALHLAQSLSDEQRMHAVLQEHSFGNIVTGPGRGESLKEPQGLSVSSLNGEQRDMLLKLVETYVGLARDEIGKSYMGLVREGLDKIRFAWAGGMNEGDAFYYRIHGPRVLIEFDNTQNNANHIHTVWRDPLDDFGRDTLKDHYESAPPGHGHSR